MMHPDTKFLDKQDKPLQAPPSDALAAAQRPAPWMPDSATFPQPYTYFKNDKGTRAFLLVGVERIAAGYKADRCILLEWGKSRTQPVAMPLAVFLEYVGKKQLTEFTPQMPEHGK